MITVPRMRKFGAGQKIGLMAADKRDSDSGLEFRDTVIAQLASVTTQLRSLATKDDISAVRLEILELKSGMTETMHGVISEKVKDKMSTQHSTCLHEFKDIAKEQREEHEKQFHPRSSQAPRQKSIWDGFMPAFLKVLPYIIAALGLGGGGLIATQNTTQPVPQSAPDDNGE